MFGLKIKTKFNMSNFNELIEYLNQFRNKVSAIDNFGYFITYDTDNKIAEISIEYNSEDEIEILSLMEEIQSQKTLYGFIESNLKLEND